MFFLLYKCNDDAVFDDFPKISDHFPKISEDFPKYFRRPDEHFRTFSEHFPKINEDCRRLPKATEDVTTTTTTSLFHSLNIQVSHHLQIARLIEAGGVRTLS